MSSIVKVPLFSHAKVLNHITDHKLVLKFRDSFLPPVFVFINDLSVLVFDT